MCFRRVDSSSKLFGLGRLAVLAKFEAGLNETTFADLTASSRLTNKATLAESAEEFSVEGNLTRWLRKDAGWRFLAEE